MAGYSCIDDPDVNCVSEYLNAPPELPTGGDFAVLELGLVFQVLALGAPLFGFLFLLFLFGLLINRISN